MITRWRFAGATGHFEWNARRPAIINKFLQRQPSPRRRAAEEVPPFLGEGHRANRRAGFAALVGNSLMLGGPALYLWSATKLPRISLRKAAAEGHHAQGSGR